MTTMKSVRTGEQHKIAVFDAERPAPGPKDALTRIRACGICGTDTHFLHLGGAPSAPAGRWSRCRSAMSRRARSSRSAPRSGA
ncbi:hypothetical protein SAZ11_26045 [Streptomyces sp. FXJ1.4098]|nr:hypothetical protein [Streptomyces sp. FXJ1.4098]